MAMVCDYEPDRLASLHVRLSAPIYPGELIVTEIWRGDAEIFFRSRVAERDVIVLNNGYAELR